MTNQEIVILKQLALISLIVAAFVAVMIFEYRKTKRSILGNIAAFFVIMYDEVKNIFWRE